MEIKICGLKRPADARLAVRLGARWIGIVRSPHSPRTTTLDEARRVIDAAREADPSVRPVLATGRRSREEVERDARFLGVERVQPHGLDAAGLETLRSAGFLVHRVVVVPDGAGRLPRFRTPGPAEGPLVFDVGGGGTGRAFDWRIFGRRAPDQAFVAGGLRPENVARLLPYDPWGVDVSSGVESAPGVKDPERMRRFVDRLGAGAG